MDNTELENIYYQAGVRYYNDNFKFLIEKVISELYYSNWHLLKFLTIEHIDRAVFKYKAASENKKIYNTKNYFKACLRSSVEELGFDE